MPTGISSEGDGQALDFGADERQRRLGMGSRKNFPWSRTTRLQKAMKAVAVLRCRTNVEHSDHASRNFVSGVCRRF